MGKKIRFFVVVAFVSGVCVYGLGQEVKYNPTTSSIVCGQLILSDDFEDGNATGWIDGNVHARANWTVENGKFKLTIQPGPYIAIWRFRGVFNWTDYCYSADFKRVSGTEHIFYVRYSSSTGYVITVSPSVVAVAKWVNGVSVAGPYFYSYFTQDGVTYRITIEAEGNTIRCRIGNDLIFTYADVTNPPIREGRIGIGGVGTSGGTAQYVFDNIEVRCASGGNCQLAPSPEPIVLVHGWSSEPSVWNTMKNWLRQDGFSYIWPIQLEKCGVPGERNFEVNAQILANRIQDSINAMPSDVRDGINIINIIAHSMGGLVSRRYIEGALAWPGHHYTDPWTHRPVRNLLMLGTPNSGVGYNRTTNLAASVLFCRSGPGADEMKENRMKDFNFKYHPSGPKIFSTTFRAAYGTAGTILFSPNYRCMGGLGAFIKGRPNDGLVSKASAVGITDYDILFPTQVASDSYCHRDYPTAPDLYSGWIRPILTGQLSNLAESKNNFAVDTTDTVGAPVALDICNSLFEGNSRTDTLQVEPCLAFGLLVACSDSNLHITLESPTGAIYDSTFIAPDTSSWYFRDSLGSQGFFINAPDSGHWLLHLNGQDITQSPATYCVMLTVDNSVSLNASLSEDYPLPGSPVFVSATLMDNGSPITAANVTVVPILEETDTLPVLSLYDDGLHYDSSAGDGLYGNAFIQQASDSGVVTFYLTATGSTASVGMFRRETTLSCYITFDDCAAKPGDANSSSNHTLADIISTVNYIFNKPGFPSCPSNSNLCWLSDLLCRGDWNGSGTVTLSDVIQGVNYIFNKPGGPWNPIPSGPCCLPVP